MTESKATPDDGFWVALEEPEHAYAIIVDDPTFKQNAKEIKRFCRDNAGHEIRRVDRVTALQWMNNYMKKYKGAA